MSYGSRTAAAVKDSGSLSWNGASDFCGMSSLCSLLSSVWRWLLSGGHLARKCTVSSSPSLQSWPQLLVDFFIICRRDCVM